MSKSIGARGLVSVALRIGSAVADRIAERIDSANRKRIADEVRMVADEIERGDVVSDEQIDAVKWSTDRIREQQERSAKEMGR